MKMSQVTKLASSILLCGTMSFSLYAHDGENNTDQLDNGSMHTFNLRPSEHSESYAWAMAKSNKLKAPNFSTSLPTKCDFSSQIEEIHNQGALGSCSAQALTLSMELSLQKNNMYTSLSPLYVYYNERVLENNVNYDSGATLSDGIQAICTWGACKEATWPYVDYMTTFKIKPSEAAYTEGEFLANLGAIVPNHVDYSLSSIKYALSQNIPVIFGVFVYPSFNTLSVSKTGKVPIPAPNERPLGGHALTFVGYNDDTQEFKFANSWGTEWGDNGCGYLTYQYVMNEGAKGSRLFFFPNDLWSIGSRPVTFNSMEETTESK